MRRLGLFALLALTILPGCKFMNVMDRARPMTMRCTTERSKFIRTAADVFQRNGYLVTKRDEETGTLEARDSVERVSYPFSGLVREWTVQHMGDSVVVTALSLSTRLDDSEVVQTWDKQRSNVDDRVKDWMRPVMTSLESACGLGSPLMPNPR